MGVDDGEVVVNGAVLWWWGARSLERVGEAAL